MSGNKGGLEGAQSEAFIASFSQAEEWDSPQIVNNRGGLQPHEIYAKQARIDENGVRSLAFGLLRELRAGSDFSQPAPTYFAPSRVDPRRISETDPHGGGLVTQEQAMQEFPEGTEFQIMSLLARMSAMAIRVGVTPPRFTELPEQPTGGIDEQGVSNVIALPVREAA